MSIDCLNDLILSKTISFIKYSLKKKITYPIIISLIKEVYKRAISQCIIILYQNEVIYDMINEVSKTLAGTSVDKLIAQFTSRDIKNKMNQ